MPYLTKKNVNQTSYSTMSDNFLMKLIKLSQTQLDNISGSNEHYQSIKTNNQILVRILNLIEKENKCSDKKTTRFPLILPTLDVTTRQGMIPVGELLLILVVLSLWLLSILLCLSKYQKLRSIPPMLPPYSSEPMHIEDVKIVKDEQDTIIYRKKPTYSRYSALKKSPIETKIISHHVLSDDSLKASYKSRIRSNSEPRLTACLRSDTVCKPYWSYSRDYYNRFRLKQLLPQHALSLSYNPTQTDILRAKFFDRSSNRVVYQFSKTTHKRLSDRRTLYAKSKFRKPLSEIKNSDRTLSMQSKDEMSMKGSNDSNEAVLKISRQFKKLSRNMALSENPKSSDLLDPNWIPPQVRESLLNLHYNLHKKPTLLQTSRISKSDSNLKSRSVLPMDELSKKIFSLQNTNDKKHSCLL
ncbi:hypothetical protein BpHYR1_053603 [Brachionus plicatilis]|uniref:Uncharacterized protein n=1 Tax=Brachionus plicatilis TaxID=10195 RepID=A0A3M7PHF2_BRAPC|nr:hypothetical protein BpHYR1_053603 [Brachionus plicatilis]